MHQNKSGNLLIIGSVLPEPNSSAAGWRMLQVIDLFQEQGFAITFASTASQSEFTTDLQKLNINCQEIKLNDASFDVFLKELNPRIVLFDRFYTEEQFGWRVAEICPKSLRILDTEDLHCLRAARQLAVKEQRKFEAKDLFSDVAKREIASIYRCDLSLIISEFEYELLQTTFRVPTELLQYLPLFASTPKQELPAFHERTDFMFIGNFLHEPNWDAVRQLKEKIWSGIRSQLPQANLLIYGAYAGEKVLQLHNPTNGFLIKGRAENSFDELRKTRILLAPLRFGAGIKGKLLEAMSCGTPSITTEIGTEGMCGELPWSGTVTDQNETFIQAAIDLYSNQNYWEKAQQNGFAIVKERFQKAQFSEAFTERIADLIKNKEHYRLQNFTGAMLLHHTLSSTKYLSKWIEEKGKQLTSD